VSYTEEYVQQLRLRLRRAEQVCGLVGMTATDRVTPRGKALIQSWMNWSHLHSGEAVPITDEEVEALAQVRDGIVEETLARIARDYPEIDAKIRNKS
jgi:hypothetical protein